MRLWLGKTFAPAIIAFRGGALLNKAGKPLSTNYTSWPIRKLYGFAIGRTMFVIARCDPRREDWMEPHP